jgi:hypothetical protein
VSNGGVVVLPALSPFASSVAPCHVQTIAEVDRELGRVRSELDSACSPLTLLRQNLRQFLDFYAFYTDFCRPSVLNDMDGKGTCLHPPSLPPSLSLPLSLSLSHRLHGEAPAKFLVLSLPAPSLPCLNDQLRLQTHTSCPLPAVCPGMHIFPTHKETYRLVQQFIVHLRDTCPSLAYATFLFDGHIVAGSKHPGLDVVRAWVCMH